MTRDVPHLGPLAVEGHAARERMAAVHLDAVRVEIDLEDAAVALGEADVIEVLRGPFDDAPARAMASLASRACAVMMPSSPSASPIARAP